MKLQGKDSSLQESHSQSLAGRAQEGHDPGVNTVLDPEEVTAGGCQHSLQVLPSKVSERCIHMDVIGGEKIFQEQETWLKICEHIAKIFGCKY